MEHSKKRAFHKYTRVLFLALFIIALYAVSEITGLRSQLNSDYIRQFIEANLGLGFLTFSVLFTLANLVQIPGVLFLIGAVLALGPLVGGAFTYGAASLSCVMCFLLIRAIGQDSLRQVQSKWLVKLLKGLDRHPIRSVLLLRILFQTAPALNYALALSGVPFRHHLYGTVLGLPLPIALYCIFFDQVQKWAL